MPTTIGYDVISSQPDNASHRGLLYIKITNFSQINIIQANSVIKYDG